MGPHQGRSKTIPRPRLWGESSRSAGTGHFGGSRTTKNVYRCNIDYLINKYVYTYIYIYMYDVCLYIYIDICGWSAPPPEPILTWWKGRAGGICHTLAYHAGFYVNTLQNTQTECVWRNTLFHAICFKARLSNISMDWFKANLQENPYFIANHGFL